MISTEFWRHPSIPQLEVRRSCQENTCYRPHSHDTVSIGVIDSGRSIFSGIAKKTIILNPGDVIVIPTDHLHACNPLSGNWRYQMIHADQIWLSSLLSDNQETQLFSRITVFRDPTLYRGFTEANSKLFSEEEISLPGVESMFVNLMRQCASTAMHATVESPTETILQTRLQPVFTQLANFHDQKSSLSDLGALVGMSRYQLIRAVKSATGFTPTAWRQNHQVRLARKLLQKGSPLAQTASRLGFTDQSHFHRVFHAHVATTPGKYRS